ncbi:MAG: DNA polymerase III subunit delta [Rhodospirillales bacterium]
MAAVLLFGADRGLVRERSNDLVRGVAGETPDPFRLIEMTTAELRADPVALSDAARSFSLVPGRRIIRIRDAGEPAAEAVRLLLGDGAATALVICEAGDLGKRSGLRLIFEAAPSAAAVACFPDEGDGLRALIEETLAGFGLRPTAAATALLSSTLGADRALSRCELEKLALYCGRGGTGIVEDEDVAAVVGNQRLASLSSLAMLAAGGDIAGLNRALSVEEGLEPIGLLRAAAQHLQRLHRVKAEVATGRPVRDAVLALRPPVFFRLIDGFTRQVGQWNEARLEEGLVCLARAEIACKQTGAPQAALAVRALLRVARLAHPGPVTDAPGRPRSRP